MQRKYLLELRNLLGSPKADQTLGSQTELIKALLVPSQKRSPSIYRAPVQTEYIACKNNKAKVKS